MNSILIKILSQQVSQKQILQNELKKLKNPYFANLVILIEAYFFQHQKLIQTIRINEELQNTVIQNTENQRNAKFLKQFIGSCFADIDMNILQFKEEYWNGKINSVSQPSILLVQLGNLFKKISYKINQLLSQEKPLSKQISLHHQVHAPLQWVKQKKNLQVQISNLSSSLTELQRQMKQNEQKYKSQLSYYQRMQQKSARSSYHIQQSGQSKRSIRSSKSVKSLKSVQSSDSKSSNKFDDVKNYYKQSMEEFSKEQKKLLQKIQSLSIQKDNLAGMLQNNQYRFRQAQKRIIELQSEIAIRQRSQYEIRAKYQSDFDSLRYDLQVVKSEVVKQVQSKQKQVEYYKQAYEIIAKKYKQLIQTSTNIDSKTLQSITQITPHTSFHSQHLQQKIQQRLRHQNDQKVNLLQEIISNLQLQKQNLQNQSISQKKQIKLEFQNIINQLNIRNQKMQRQILLFKQRQQNLQLSKNQDLQILKDLLYNKQTSQQKSMHTNTTEDIKKVDQNTYLVTHHTTIAGNSVEHFREINEIEELKMRIREMEQQRNHSIQTQVLRALKSQQQQFNHFLNQNMYKMQQHYLQQVIPQKVRQAEQQSAKVYSITQITTPSATNIPIDFNEQVFVNQKYEQWKLTYLPVILQLKYKEWLEKYQTTELQKIIKQKYEEWENIRLLSIMKEKKNAWILDQLWEQKTKQWNHKHQQIISHKIRQIEQYWEKTVIPQRLRQWETTHVTTSVTVTGVHYSASDLQRILAQQHAHWQRQFDAELQMRLHAAQQQWEVLIIPQIRLQWQNQVHIKKSTEIHHADLLTIDQIINAKYEQWKHTYLVEYLRIQKQKWLEQFRRTQLQILIKKKYDEWENLRLLSIVKQPRNSWVLQAILKQKYFQWERQREQQWLKRLRDFQIEWENTTLVQRRSQWQKEYTLPHPHREPEVIIKEVIKPQVVIKQVIKQVKVSNDEQIRRYEITWKHQHEQELRIRLQQIEQHWQKIVHDERIVYEQNLQNALNIRTQEVQAHWQNIILPQIRNQWEITYIQQHPQPLRNVQQEEHRINILVNQRTQEWRRIQLVRILQEKQHQWHSHFMNTEFIKILNTKQAEWTRSLQSEFNIRLNTILIEERHKYEIDFKNSHNQKDQTQIHQLKSRISQLQFEYQSLQSKYTQLQKSRNQSVNSKEAIYKLESENLKQISELKLKYEEKIAQLTHQKSLLTMQIKQMEINFQKSKPKQINISSIQTSYEKQFFSLEATIKTKQSEIIFLKKSLDSASSENQELNNRIMNLNHKISALETSLDQTKNHSIKFQYEIKYLKQKQSTFNKKIDAKEVEFNELKSRFDFDKGLMEKKIRELTSNTQSVSTLQIKLSELQSQLSLKLSNLKTLENDLERKKRQLEQQKQKSLTFSRDMQMYKSTIKQHESIVQDLRLQIRKSCDQINRQKVLIESFEHKQRSYIEQLKKVQIKSRDKGQFQEIIRQNQRLRVQNYRIKEKLIFIQSNQSKQIIRLRETIRHLQIRLKTEVHHYREGDITQIQILKRINHEISDLVSTNKQLQMRIIVLQNQKELSAFGISIQRFFVAFQQQMDNLINYLITNQLFTPDTLNLYNKFQQKSRQALSHGYVEDYFRQWQAFMRGIVEENFNQLTKNQSKSINLRRSDEQADDIIEKYDAVLNDVKFTLGEFIKTGDQQYLTMMSKSLGIEIQSYQHQENTNNQREQHRTVVVGQNTFAHQ